MPVRIGDVPNGLLGVDWGDVGVVDLINKKVLCYTENAAICGHTHWAIPHVNIMDMDFLVLASEGEIAQGWKDAFMAHANWNEIFDLLFHPKFEVTLHQPENPDALDPGT